MTETVLVIEATLDDMSPEIAGYVLERALALGALDAYATAAQMKKGRPGVVLTLLARPEEREAMTQLLLRETTTLGVRVSAAEREVLERAMAAVATEYGPIGVKVASGAGGEVKAAPEYEDCRAAALRHGAPLRAVFAAALAAYGAMKK